MIKQRISREQWQELDLSLQLGWCKYFKVKDIWAALPDIGQIIDYLAGAWIPEREELFNGKGELIDKLWAFLLKTFNKPATPSFGPDSVKVSKKGLDTSGTLKDLEDQF